ncbi:flagellin N-terminal helical domain-containing protein [Bacillus benzoevorans]|uniref:Flagellin n=1 Tax=Bacillus benzoevorans TaxID=1456 RepID=A0A7X0HWM7_9BACI|nr:flagellin [Bacillus benzoevorans]MBB6447287.1 flagellin [Bacillus benzoevorans]
MIQTAEGALNETHSILQRVRELADQSANGTNTADDRKAIQDEVTQLKEEIDRIGNTTEFNTQKLLNGNLKSAGGASVGQNTTTGAAISKLSEGSISGALANAAADNSDFVKETINVDGTDIDVNWQDLSSSEKAVLKNADTDADSKKAAAELIQNKINEAIDASGKNVEHVKAYVDASDNLVVESGSKGTKSIVEAGSAGVLTAMTGGATGAAGESNYNGTALAGTETADLYVNGTLMEVTLPAADPATPTTMDDLADDLAAAINASIAAYNGTTGKADGDEGWIKDVTVKATDDGRLLINSESGPVELKDRAGQTAVADLGLTQAQTDASGNGGMTFQIGANKGQTITFGVNDMRSAALGISGVDVSTQAGASNALETLDKAIKNVSSERGKLGAVQNRLEHTINNLNTSSENLTAAESRIRDVDYALAA